MPILQTQSTIENLTDTLSHLVRFPTLTEDRATNRAALDWIQEQLSSLPLNIRRAECAGYPALVATTRDTKNPKLWLAGHLDVVGGSAGVFEPKIKDGKLTGRGAYDMKGAIATYIQLLKGLGEAVAQYDLGLMITTDEEIGGAHGVNHLVNELGYRGGAVILPDGGLDWNLETGAKGLTWWKVKAQGLTAHGSRTWAGNNAISKLYQYLNLLQQNFPTEPCGEPTHYHATLNVGVIKGGQTVNQVADSAEAEIDIRFTPEIGLEQAEAWVNETAAAIPGITLECLTNMHSYHLPQDGPVALWRSIAEDMLSRKLGTVFSNGGSDARYFAAHGIPCIVFYPEGGDIHGEGEWVSLEDLGKFHDAARRFLDAWAKI